jgi:hypothetical protein
MKDWIWIVIGCCICFILGLLVVGGYQLALLMHGDPLVEWWRIIAGGLVYGGLLAALMIIYVWIGLKDDNTKTIQS